MPMEQQVHLLRRVRPKRRTVKSCSWKISSVMCMRMAVGMDIAIGLISVFGMKFAFTMSIAVGLTGRRYEHFRRPYPW